jgi:CRP-like cAMP-binding protein
MSHYLLDAAQGLLEQHICDGVRPDDMLLLFADCGEITLSDGELICQEGERAGALFILVQGQVRVLKRDACGRERELAVLSAPALLGHMSLVDSSPRSATCLAAGSARVLTLASDVYHRNIKAAVPAGTALRRLLLASLTQQLVRATNHLDALLRPLEDEARTDEQDAESLLEAAGLLSGWKVDTSGLEDLELVSGEDRDR